MSALRSDDDAWQREQRRIESEDQGIEMRLNGELLVLPRTFLDEHPGGPDVISQFQGKDCTAEYLAAGHSPAALEWARRYVRCSFDKQSTSTEAGQESDCMEEDDRTELESEPADDFAEPPIHRQDQSPFCEALPVVLALTSIGTALVAWRLFHSAKG